jgi:hypothetical protein
MRNSYKILVAYKILFVKSEAKGTLGRPRRKWEGVLECILRK